MAETLPSLQQFTVCSWIKFYSDNNHEFTLISYATSNSANQITIDFPLFRDKEGLERKVRLVIGQSYLSVTCDYRWKIGEWYHLCATWFSSTSTAKVYQNGRICPYAESNIPFEKTIIPSGGILVIGQDQDVMDGGYNADQSWHGDIADLQIWDEELNIFQIQQAGNCNEKMKDGNVFSWMKTRLIAIDNVAFSETQLCYPY